MEIITALLALCGTALAGVLTKHLQMAKKYKILSDLLDIISDGQITKEEIDKLVADAKELVTKKK